MNIQFNEHLILFRDLSPGEVFRDKEGNYCMKLESNIAFNFVYLDSGVLGLQDSDFFVYQANAILKVD